MASVSILRDGRAHFPVGLAQVKSEQRRFAPGRDRGASGWPGTTLHHDRSDPVLAAIDQGDPLAAEKLLPLVYSELRKLAAQKLVVLPRGG